MVVKFYRPLRWSNAQIFEEHDFSLELQSSELPIIAPYTFKGTSLHNYAGYRFALFPYIGARQFEVDNLKQLEEMGRLIGRIHAISAKNTFTHRLSINIQEYLHEPSQTLRQSKLVPAHLRSPFFTILEQLCILCESKYTSIADRVLNIRLHGDCHPGNVLWRDGPILVDLDDCRCGPAIQDIWMMLTGDDDAQQQTQLDILINAYQEFTKFDALELELIEPLRAMRIVQYMAWLAKRWKDPAFPRAFPWFGEDKYWENQILAMKEQLSALQQPAVRLSHYE
jgi:Ser/Thr protein kinase RdoA (MazF antagonist)